MNLLFCYHQIIKTTGICILLAIVSLSGFAQGEAKIFTEYRQGKLSLPDFSYVGYHHGEKDIPTITQYKIFNVIDFGAIANDTISDKKAIQSAISAANKEGSGIVFFPKGRFLVNEESDVANSIVSKGSKIIFRGSGSGIGGTELFMHNTLPPADPNKMWTVPPLFIFTSGKVDKKIGNVTRSEKIGSFNLTINATNGLKEGDWIMLSLLNNNNDLINAELAPYQANPTWSYLLKTGIDVKLYYQIKKIKDKTLTLTCPISYNIDTKYSWDVYRFGNSEEVGIENIAFTGNWKDEFKHHRSWRDDSGFTFLNLKNLTNSWLKNCVFTDCSVAAIVVKSANVSVINCIVTGNPGHEAITSNGSTNVLIAKCTDEASQWHSFGSSHGSMNTVIWRSSYPSTTSFEAHASQPRNTLLDNVTGGLMQNRGGGAIENMPNHMQGLILWNYQQTNKPVEDFEFWPASSPYWKIPNPIIVGFKSKGSTFNREQIGHLESLGEFVEPNSLYEAQLKLRLKELPNWLKELK